MASVMARGPGTSWARRQRLTLTRAQAGQAARPAQGCHRQGGQGQGTAHKGQQPRLQEDGRQARTGPSRVRPAGEHRVQRVLGAPPPSALCPGEARLPRQGKVAGHGRADGTGVPKGQVRTILLSRFSQRTGEAPDREPQGDCPGEGSRYQVTTTGRAVRAGTPVGGAGWQGLPRGQRARA